MGATSCYNCGAAIEEEYQNYCRRCGANLHISEEEAHDEANHEIFREPITASTIPHEPLAAKPQADKDLEFLTELRKQINVPLRELRTLWVSFAPIALPLPFTELKIDSHDEKHGQSENTLKRLLQQRLDSVTKPLCTESAEVFWRTESPILPG